MKSVFFKGIAFFVIIIALFAINMIVFRSDYPMFWFVTLLGSVVTLIIFPYKKFFNLKNQK